MHKEFRHSAICRLRLSPFTDPRLRLKPGNLLQLLPVLSIQADQVVKIPDPDHFFCDKSLSIRHSDHLSEHLMPPDNGT